MSANQIKYLKKLKIKKIIIFITQISIALLFFITWELLSKYNIINSFIFSSPSKILSCLKELNSTGKLFNHILITSNEVLISFILGSVTSFLIAIILYMSNTLKKITDPYITILNSLPKVALGPIIIIWIGANNNSIIFMALLINFIVSLIGFYNGFTNTDPYKIKLMKTLKATKIQTLTKLVIPSSLENIFSTLKLNISMSLIGVIMGEFLVSKEGIGYLILYGTQVFNLNLVMTGIFILIIQSFIFYKTLTIIEKILIKNHV